MALTANQDWLYKQMSGMNVDLGSEEQFAQAMQDESNRQWVYEQAGKMGIDLGTPEQFASAMQMPDVAEVQQTTGGMSGGSLLSEQEELARQNAIQGVTNGPNHSFVEGEKLRISDVQRPQDYEGESSFYGLSDEDLNKQIGEYDQRRTAAQEALRQQQRSRKRSFAEQLAAIDNPALQPAQDQIEVNNVRLSDEDEERYARLQQEKVWRERNSESYQELGDAILETRKLVNSLRDQNGRNIDSGGASAYLDKAIELYQAPSKYGQQSGFKNWAEGLGAQLSDYDTYTLGITEAFRAGNMAGIVKKLNKGENLTDQEQANLQSFLLLSMVEKAREQDLSTGYTIGKQSAESIPFMLEMLATAGLGAAGEKALVKSIVKSGNRHLAERVARMFGDEYMVTAARKKSGKIVKDIALNRVEQGLLERGARQVGEDVLMTAAMPTTWASVNNDRVNEMLFGDDHDYGFMDFMRSFTSATLETGTERWGGKIVDKTLNKVMPLDKIWGKQKWGKLLSNDFIHSPFGETGEEYINAIASAVRSVNPLYSDKSNEQLRAEAEHMFTPSGFAQTFLTVLPMSAIGGTVNVGIAKYKLSQYQNGKSQLTDLLTGLGASTEQAENIIRQIESSEDTSGFAGKVAETERILLYNYQVDHPNATKEEYEAFKKQVDKTVGAYFKGAAYLNELTGELRDAYAAMSEEDKQRCRDAWNEYVVAEFENKVPEETTEQEAQVSPAAAEYTRAVDEVTQSVGERTHGNGYIYPVAMPGNAEKTGYIVGEVVPVIDESNPEQFQIENDDVVTVKWSDGTVTQERARDLDLTGAPMMAQQAVDIEVENQMYAYTQQRIQNGEQPVLMRNGEGILEGFFPTEGGLLEDQNGVQYTPEQLAEQGWQETKPVLFVNDTQQIAALDNGDGTYTQVDALGNPIAEPMSAEAFREQGFAMVPLEEEQPKSQAQVEAPVVQQAPVEQAPELQQPEVQEPAAPVVPNIETMSAADYAGAAVEYMGSREYVDEYLDGEIKKVQQQLDVANRKKVGNVTDMADFKAKKDAIEAEKKALQTRLDKLTEAREKAKSYLTIAEREQRAQAEAERRAAEEAARIAREQAAAAEAARLEQERIDRELKKGVPDFSEDNDRDARNRGFHVLNGQVIHRQEPLQPLATGKAVTVQFAKGQNGAAEAHHVLIPVSMAQPSHINGQRNPAFFISEAQPKDRRDQVSKVTSDMMAQNIHPDEIVDGATAYVGAPVLNGRGEAVQGNNRLDALIKMYQSHPESVAKYKQYLIDNAAALGYTETDIETIRNNDVIDVRMLDNVTDEQAIQLGQKKATDLETGGVQLIDPQVTANQLGDRIQRFSEILLKSNDDEATLADLTLRNGRPALEFLQQLGIISDAQMQSAFDSRGNLTAEAKAALQGVLKQVLFQNADSDNLPIMFDDIPVTAQKAILQTIVRDLQSPEESRLVPDIQEAIGALYRALHQSAEVKNGRNEQEIRAAMRSWALQMQFPSDFDAENFVPSEIFSNFALELATLFKYGKQTEIAKALNAYYDAVQGTTGSLFGDTPAIPYNEAVKQIFNIDYERKREVGTAVADNSEAGDGGRREQHAVDTDRESGSDESRSAVAGTGDNAAGSGIGSSAEGTGDTGDVTQAEREGFVSLVNQYLTSISSKETKGVLFDNNSMVSLFRELGFPEEMIQAIEEAQNEGDEVQVRGFNHNGVVFLNVDAISTPEDARNNYVHERQHSLTLADPHWVGEVMKATSEEELTDLLNKYTKNHYYDNKKFVEKADEFISYAMEIAYSVANNEELERALKDMGANDALINIIKSINDEQRKDNDLSLARRTPFVDGRDGGDSQQNGRDRGTRAETGLEPEGAGSAESGTRGTESGAEQVTASDEWLNSELGKNYQELRKLYPQHIPVLRVGGEYHLYGDEAIVAGRVLGIEPTSRRGTSFISFPHKELEKALPELIRAGHRVVIVNDMEKPETAETPTNNRETGETRATETEIGGALVDRLGDMGVSVSTDLDANRDALKAAKADKSDAGAIHYYKTPSGQQYGFSYKGRIYLDPTKIDAELPIHEYGHLWAEAMRRISPESWRSVVDTIKADQASWDFVRELRPELTDENEIAEEVIATFSGKRGAERLRAEYKKMHGKDADYKSKWGNIFQNISKAIQDFWKAVGDFLNIKYQSAEQIYDQVLKDFVDNMNPYQKVRDFLRARDAEYIQAAESGDIQKATNIFYDALRENIGNGITPYMSVGTYLQFKRLAKGVKTRDAAIIREAAEKIAPLIPDNAVLVPTPSHTGRATDMLDLANAIAEITGSEVADILRSAPRESQYQAKKETGTPIASQQLGIMMEGAVPADKTAIVIDNVVDSGNTAEACIQALGKGVVVTLADSAEQYRHAASLRSAAPILRDKDGNIVPLTKRFNLNGSRYLGRRMYLRPDDPRFAISGTQVIPVGEKTLVGLHNISAEKLRKAIKMGGLANPSTAVIDIARQNHEQYGDISLIMPSSLVDSKTGRNAGTFTGDIWSPTYPSVERIMSDKGDEAYYQAITKAFGDNEARRPILSRAKLDFDDYLDSGNIRAGLAYWYLLEKGIEPGDVYFNSGISDDIKERFRPLYDKGILDLTKEDYRTLLSLIAEQQGKTAEDMLQDAQESKARYQQTIDDPEAKQFYKKIAQQAIDEIDLYGVRYNVLSNGYHAMERAVRDDGKIDLTSTLIAAQDIVQTQYQADFDKWLSDMDKRFDIKEVLFEDYDRDGNRIYKPHTLANASRMMNKEDLQNAGDHSGLGATRGQLVERMETLADIRAEKGRLRPGTEEDIETEEWNKMQDEWFNKVLNPLSDMQKISNNQFSNVGYAETRLQEALRTKDPIATLNKEYGYKIDPNGEWAKNLRDMVQRVKDLPTKYFETKFRRPVYLNEFANAVVPVGLPQDLRDGLTGAGMTLFEYDPAEQGSRRAATLKATADEGIRFSISGNTRTRYAEEMESIKNEAVNNGTFMQAPNGKPSRLNERQWLQVRLRSFKRWFGDWENDPQNASKVLDENGEPLVVYHRTNNKFTQFDPERAREQSGWPTADFGFYFSNVNERGHYGRKSMPVFLNIRNPREIDVDYYADFDYNYKHADPKEMRKGNDGLQINIGRLILDEKATKVFVAPNPNQIKSATDNDGDFSEENDDIRFSISNQNNDIFYSNAERAVEGIKQEKATPEQWRAMIEKAGGLKAGEDKWIGLSDWLAQQRPTVTPQANETRSQFVERAVAENKRFTLSKQDLLDYIREHKIQIEETHYQEGLSEESQERLADYRAEFDEYFAEAEEATGSLYIRDFADYAWRQMADKYGDDFESAFELDDDGRGNWTINPVYDWGNELSGPAKYFLEGNDNAPINSTRLDYTTEGLENKREIALTVPTIESWNEDDEIHFGDAGEGKVVAWARFGDAKTISKPEELAQAEQEYKEFSRKMIAQYGLTYTERVMSDSERQQESDLIAKLNQARKDHPQVEEKVLVIDEIQSKRHQEGREKGYVDVSNTERIKYLENKIQDGYSLFSSEAQEVERMMQKPFVANEYHLTPDATWLEMYDDEYQYHTDFAGKTYSVGKWVGDEEDARQYLHELITDDVKDHNKSIRDAVPVAPFEKNWHELAMKRILRFAAENGYDKVAWTTGDQQAARYNIGEVIDSITRNEDEDYPYSYSVMSKDHGELEYDFDENGIYHDDGDPELDGKSMSDVFGKELAKRLQEMPAGETIDNEGLRIGGEGMRGFYDDILPRFMQKYGKKWGVQVGEVTMPQLEDGYQTMHAIDINDAMRESVLEGQPMFSISGRSINGTMKPQEGETRSQYIARVAETVKNMTPRNTTIDDAIRFSITVNHNSPYLLKRADGAFIDPETGERLGFDLRFIGKGEGNQAHGWGSYFSVNDLRNYAEGQVEGTYKGKTLSQLPNTRENLLIKTLLEKSYYLRSVPFEARKYALKRTISSAKKNWEDMGYPERATLWMHQWLNDDDYLAEYQKFSENYDEWMDGLMKEIDAFDENDFNLPDRHHYTVEIPDNDGTNYLEETEPMNERARKAIADGLVADGYQMEEKSNDEFSWLEFRKGDFSVDPDNQIGLNEDATYRDFIHDNFHGYDSKMLPKISEYLSKAGIVGIHYDGRRDGECYVIFDENDAKITDHIRFSIGGNTQEESDFFDDYIRFSIRKEPAPKKTGIGYKVFYRGKDGKLYPPMVANPNGEDTPIGVWLNADAAPVAGESKTGRPQVKAGGKGTQGGSGQLAYRPGWHLGEIPYALQFNRKDENGEKTLFPKDFVWAEVEYAADNDYQEEAMREGVNTSGKFQHSLAGLKHVPTNGFYRYRTNPNPATDPWIITGAMKVNRVLTNEEVDEIVRAAGREPQRRESNDRTWKTVAEVDKELQEKGYSDESPIRFSIAYHGTGADFDKFLKSKINTGEGSQAFGWGLYFTDAKEIAEDYAKRQARQPKNVKDAYLGEQKLNPVAPETDYDCLAWVLDMNELRNIRTMNPDLARSIVKNTIALKSQELKDRIKFYEGNGATRMVESAREELEYYRRAGELVREIGIPNIEFRGDRNLYTVSIPEDNGMNYFEWNAEIDERLKSSIIDGIVRRMEQMPEYGNTPGYAARIVPEFMQPYHVGGVVYQVGTRWLPKEEMSEVLAELGYKGIKYDAGTNFSQGVPDGAKNYVVFDDKDIEITDHIRFSISGSGTMKPQEGETRKEYIERVAAAVKRMTPRSATIDDAIRFSITVNHNSPYLLKKADGSFVDPETGERLGFDHRFMGKGEGGQAHGWGTYLSVNDLRGYAEVKRYRRDAVLYKGHDADYYIDLRNKMQEDKRSSGINLSNNPNYIEAVYAPMILSFVEEEGDFEKGLIKFIKRYPEEMESFFRESFKKEDFTIPSPTDRHHYTVEIPDNDGTNYLEEIKTLPKPLRRKIAAAVRELPGKPMPSVKYVNYTGGWRQLADMIERNQWAYMEIRDRLVQAFGSKLTDEKRLSNMMHNIGFVGIHYDGRRDGECYVIFDENDAVITDHIRFAISGNGKAPSSAVTEALVKQANDSFRLMQSALRKVSADLRTINAIRTQQFEYDRKVVNMLLDLYNSLLQENSVWAGYMPDTTRRIATQIVHAIGKKDISAEVNTIMDHMVHAQAKAAQRQWDKLRTTPVDKINISGVVMQGKVALQGQHALKAMNEALDSKATIEQLEDQIAQLMNMEDNATDESLKLQYKGQWIGYTIAAQHLERIQHLVDERNQLDIELQAARSNRAIKPSARQQLVANIQQAMRDNYIAQADAYAQSAKDLAEYVTTQEEQAKDFIHRQDANRDKIRSYAQRDLEGLATNPNRNRTRGNIARQIWDAFASPIRDLQSLLRLTGLHAPDGEGYLYNHFMRGWMDGADKERLGIVNAGKTLDAKISELTHGKYKTWEEAARKINDASHNMFTITMLNGVDGKDMPVTEDIPLSAGNALYIYAVNKMNDGRMKLAGMNITEEDVKALTDKVREQFGQEILDVVDWVQSEYFSQLRNRYNPTHEALFGAPMDAIENYFPLRINANARQQNEDLSEPDTDAARLLAGTSTGAIKRRTKNSLPLDVRNADFFQEVIRHISQMERWNAFAQWNRDANILFSDINFRNRIKGMKGTIYGEGDKLYNYMKDAFRVAIGTYKPKTDTFSEITLNIAKGVTSAKINFRVWTAMKQIASFPAFFTYMTDGVFVGSYLRNWMKPHETMKWARENLPNFEKRVSKRDMGDMRLMQRTTDWQWNKRVLEWSQKYGMAANVYFDTLTCATGARAVYDSRLAEYLKKGYPQEQAEQRARQDAEQAFNTSQQSSEGAFMSAVQMDRNLVTAALTVFRTSPIQYTRNFFYHTRNLLRKFGRGSKEEQIAFRMGQYKNDGLNDEQARKAAEKDYNKSIRSDIAGFVVYGALLNILWRLVGQVPYLLFGDDDDKKKKILEDATTGGALVSPITGLIGGSYIESALDGNGLISSMFAPELPFTQDAKRAEQYLQNNKYAEFASQALSVLMQSGTGFDPLTASDMVSRIVTTLDSEEELEAATQALRVSQALLSIPQSQYEQMLIDKVVSGETDEDAALEDYIRYQKIHTAPLTWWLRNEESDEKAEENAEKRFNKLLTERDKLHNPEDYEE